MILVDSTVWVDHLRRGDPKLADLLNAGLVWTHPFIIGEVALGSLRNRETILGALRDLPSATHASNDEVQSFIERQPLYSLGIAYIDAHLLAATRLTPGMRLWTRDRRLHEVASRLGVTETSER